MANSSLIKCPICNRETTLAADPIGPFCSQRCKLIDLGKWLREDYRISEPLTPDHLADYETLEGSSLDQPDDN